MAYTADSVFNNNSSYGSFNEKSSKSYSFYINPRFPIEKQIKVVVWVIEDLSKYESFSSVGDLVVAKQIAENESGLQKQPDGTYKPFKLEGNKSVSVSFFNLPKTNPKNGNQLTSNDNVYFDVNKDPTKPNMTFRTSSLYSLQERYDKGENQKDEPPKPTNTDSYIDFALYTAKFLYKQAIYQVIFKSESDLPNFKLSENALEFTQTPQTPDPPQPVPVVDFTISPDIIKPGEKVTFTNKTTNATSFIWSALPNTSIVWETTTASNPTATFNKEGTFSISLQAKNSFGTVSFTSPVILAVTASPPPKDPPPSTDSSTSIDPSKVSSKIKLVKKSGPGEIVGVTEIEASGGSASFTGLQFTQGGTYIIEAIPTSPDLEKTEFQVVVRAEPEVIEQNKPGEEDPKDAGTRPIIAQIDDSNQKIPPLKRPIGTNADEAGESAIGMGLKPLIGYNGAEIAREVHIKKLSLFYTRGAEYDNIPLCTVQFTDSNNLIKDNPPRDDTKFQVFLNSTDNLIKSIHLVFKILKHKKEPDGTYIFEGALDVDDLYVPSSKSYKGTSFEVLRKISKKLDLGFNSNIDGNTDDDMKWINTNKPYKDFIKEIVEHSYKSENTFLYGFIDFYYCFNYIDVEKEWLRSADGDFMVELGHLERMTKDKTKKLKPLILTNEPSQESSCAYFKDYKVLNQSTSIKLKDGYRTVTRYYDEEKKQFLDFEVDSQSNSDGSTYVLKGEEADNKFADKKVKKRFLGKLDSDNVHKNYNYSPELNRKNLENLTSVGVMINLPTPNYNLYRFQKICIDFHIIGSTPTSEWPIDYRLTGQWMIIDIGYEMITSPKGNKFIQKLVCAKKELGKSPQELKEDKKAPSNEKKGDNPNQSPESNQAKPNAKYKIGDKVQLVSNDGTKYEIEVTKVLENGIEVEGTVKKLNG